MATGFPDWYRGVDIARQSLPTVAMDIAAQTLAQVAVDIAAQTLANLKVDINAQTLSTLAVDIAAQTLSTLGINIKAQDLAELVIKIAAQSVGVYVERDWATTQDNDKTLVASSIGQGAGINQRLINYTVPTGKTLYIDDMDISGTQTWLGRLDIGGSTVYEINGPANTPNPLTFTTPKKATAGQAVELYIKNTGSASGDFYANINGREY